MILPLSQHDHRPTVLLDEQGAAVLGRDGKAVMLPGEVNCPVCRLHDHTDTRLAGHDFARLPIPMWQLTCPRCGDIEYDLKSFTAEALEERRRILAQRVNHDVPSDLVPEGDSKDVSETEGGATEG